MRAKSRRRRRKRSIIKIVLDITRLLREGKLTPDEPRG
jgi:hypothetical protein